MHVLYWWLAFHRLRFRATPEQLTILIVIFNLLFWFRRPLIKLTVTQLSGNHKALILILIDCNLFFATTRARFWKLRFVVNRKEILYFFEHLWIRSGKFFVALVCNDAFFVDAKDFIRRNLDAQISNRVSLSVTKASYNWFCRTRKDFIDTCQQLNFKLIGGLFYHFSSKRLEISIWTHQYRARR